MAAQIALGFLALASPLLLLTFLLGGPLSEWIFATLAMAFPVALIALGAHRRGHLGPLLWPLLALLVILEACWLAMWALRGQVADTAWFGGLPWRWSGWPFWLTRPRRPSRVRRTA